ncbi:MAG: polymer-forming cytoskeletal protein [Acidobacteriota bacterium]
MSIFRRDSDPPSEPKPTARPSIPSPRPSKPAKTQQSESTHIAKGSKVVGKISGTADLVIDGLVDGEVELESRVVIGPEGRVEGKVLARSVEVGGHVLGNVRGLERVEVLASGSLEGDVLSPRVVIAEGAFFKGKVEMTENVARKSQSSDAPAKSDSKPAPANAAPAAASGSGGGKAGGGHHHNQGGGRKHRRAGR